MKPIYLIGMPGSGKSTIGKKIADHLHLPFYDLDTFIEKKAKKSIPEIFRSYGEEAFRIQEADALRELTEGLVENAIIATGGGTPCFHENMDYMNSRGFTIYLELPLDKIIQNLEKDKESRPVLDATLGKDLRKKLFLLKQNRAQYYEQSRVVWAFEDVTLPDLLTMVAHLLTK